MKPASGLRPKLRLLPDPRPRSAVSAGSAGETRRAAPFRRWWCPPVARSDAVHVGGSCGERGVENLSGTAEARRIAQCRGIRERFRVGSHRPESIMYAISVMVATGSDRDNLLQQGWAYGTGISAFHRCAPCLMSLERKVAANS